MSSSKISSRNLKGERTFTIVDDGGPQCTARQDFESTFCSVCLNAFKRGEISTVVRDCCGQHMAMKLCESSFASDRNMFTDVESGHTYLPEKKNAQGVYFCCASSNCTGIGTRALARTRNSDGERVCWKCLKKYDPHGTH